MDGLFGYGWTSNLTARLNYSTYMFAAPSTYYKEAVIVMPTGTSYRFRENADGTTFTPPYGSRDTLVRNADGSFDLAPALSRSRYHFSSEGSLTSMTDDYGNTLSFVYSGGRLQQVVDATGSGKSFNIYYGPDGRIAYVQDSANRTVEYRYNGDGTLAAVINPLGQRTDYSYVPGRFAPVLSQVSDNWGRVISGITYDSVSGRIQTYTEAGETFTYEYNYQGTGAQTSKSDSSGNLRVLTYDARQRITNVSFGAYSSAKAYNADNTLKMTTDEVGVKTFYTYNAAGSIASVTRDYQGAEAVRFDYAYDPNFPGKVIAITPKNPSTGATNTDWQAWKYDYYQAGDPVPGALHHVYRVRSDGTTLDTLSTYTYNSAGQVLSVTDASAVATTYTYDPTTGDLASVTYPRNSDSGANPVYGYARDPLGRVAAVADPSGKTTTYIYDDLDRITSVTLPKPSAGSTLNFTTNYTYDNYDAATGLVFTHQTDPNGKLTKQGYDQFGQLKTSIDALGKPTTFTYTKGLLTGITDANNNTTSYNYDTLKRLQSTQFPDSTLESYTYYNDGMLNTKTERENRMITYQYDKLKRLKQKVYPNSSSITYTYVGQKLTTLTDTLSAETHSFSYDSSYRVSANTQGTRGSLDYTYDQGDRLASYAVQGGPTATHTYYDDGSLKSIEWSAVSGQFRYSYTLNGQYASSTFPNGQHRDYSYDQQGRLLSIANTHPTAGSLATFDYGYDTDPATAQPTMLGQRTSMSSSGSSTNYYYDASYQLNRVDYPNVSPFNGEVHSWSYDAIGNRLANAVNGTPQNYSYYKNGSNPNNGQRLQSDSTYTYTYDSNGNMLTKTGPEGAYNLTWDYENRLTGIAGAGLTATYTYDYLGRRTSKTVNGTTTTYIYDGHNLIAERGASSADYVFGPGIDEPLAMSLGGAVSYYTADGLGSISSLNDVAGGLQNSYQYDAWGVIRTRNEAFVQSFEYTGREFAEAGLQFSRARYYSPGIGRFVSEDEFRFRSERNLYAYATGNPILFTDPSGWRLYHPSCERYKAKIELQIAGIKTRIVNCVGCISHRQRIDDALDAAVFICGDFHLPPKETCGEFEEPNHLLLDTKVLDAKTDKPVDMGEAYYPCSCLPALILHESVHLALGEAANHTLGEEMDPNPADPANTYAFRCYPHCAQK